MKSNTAQTKPNRAQDQTQSPLLLQDRNPLLHDLLQNRNPFSSMISSMIGTRSPPSLPRSEPPLSGFTLSPSQSSPPICVLSGIMKKEDEDEDEDGGGGGGGGEGEEGDWRGPKKWAGGGGGGRGDRRW
ncbi:unnamed protein product [Camellia sinensis]